MTIKNKGFEYKLTDEEKKALKIVYNILDQLYEDDDTEIDVNDKMNVKPVFSTRFCINVFLTEYTRLNYEVFNFNLEGQDE